MLGGNVRSVFRDNLFKGKVAIVSGGGSGIGLGITEELLALQCTVVICSRKQPRIDQAVTKLQQSHGDRIWGTVCNIRDEKSVQKLFDDTLSRFGRLDYLVNNAGGQFPQRAEDISLKGWHAVVETNLQGTFLMCRTAFHSYFGDHGGVIINIIADMFKGFPGMSHTGAARAGVENITKTFAVEWAANGIRINAIAPGVIYSSTADANYQDGGGYLAKHKDRVPARRLGTVQEVSSAVSFLLSPGSQYTTGATLRIDGGSSLAGKFWDVPDHDKMPHYGYLPESCQANKIPAKL